MEEETAETKTSESRISSEVPPEVVQEDVIMEEAETEEAAVKEDEVIVEEEKEEKVVMDEEEEERREDEDKFEEVKEQRTTAGESENSEESKNVEDEKVEESKDEVSTDDGSASSGSQPAKEERKVPSTVGSRIIFRRQVASDATLTAASAEGQPTASGSHPSFKGRLSGSIGSGQRVRGIRVYNANSGAAITSGSRRSMTAKVASFSSGYQIRAAVSSSVASKSRDMLSSQISQHVKTEPESHGGRKDSGNIMGGDWRKVISKRRGATCSVEVIWKLKQSELSIERRREEREFCTGSSFAGQVDAVGMEGECSYTMPHGVVYEGAMHDGRFDCLSTLTYPNKGKVDGSFTNGRLAPSTYTFPDGLVYELEDWTYCTSETPDRRFQQEIKYGLKPVCTSLKTQQQPTRTIPEGCYDTGDGFYNPKTRCVTSPITGNIIRCSKRSKIRKKLISKLILCPTTGIPTKSEANWIAKNCRKAWDEPSGYRPSLNENFRHDDINYAPLLIESRRQKYMMHCRKSEESTS